jgi:hypothetical protein
MNDQPRSLTDLALNPRLVKPSQLDRSTFVSDDGDRPSDGFAAVGTVRLDRTNLNCDRGVFADHDFGYQPNAASVFVPMGKMLEQIEHTFKAQSFSAGALLVSAKPRALSELRDRW